MATVLTSFGCIGSATSYCCTAPPPNSDTNRNLLSYEIRMSAGSEPSGSLITRWKASLPSGPTCQCHTLLPNAQLMNPPRAAARGGFINCAFGNSVWHWQVGPDGKLAFHRVIKLPDGSLPADMRISYDNKFLFVSLFGGGAVQQYDVADPMQPKLVSTVAIPQAQMMKLAPDNKRLYVSNSLLSNLDGKVPYRVRLVNVGPSGMTLDAKFDVDFEHFPTGQARPHDMLLK